MIIDFNVNYKLHDINYSMTFGEPDEVEAREEVFVPHDSLPPGVPDTEDLLPDDDAPPGLFPALPLS